MQVKFILCTAFFAIFFAGCQKSNEKKYTEIEKFISSYDIVGKEISSNVEILFPKTMSLLNSSTVAIAEKQIEYTVKILNISEDSVSLMKQMGRKGQGPNDVRLNVTNFQKDTDKASEGIWLADIQSMKFYHYSQSGAVEENASRIEKLPTQLTPCTKSFILENSDLLGITTAINNQIFRYSAKENIVNGYDFYPETLNPDKPLMSKTIYSGDIDLKPDKSAFVLTYQWFKSLCIVQLDKLSEPRFLTFKDTPFPKLDVSDEKGNMDILRNLPLQYLDVYVTDNYIYALYAGLGNAELENHSHNALSKGVGIHVFKWDGTACCSLNLDRIINCFCVDETNRVIYGIDPTGEENSIFYRFSIPEKF